MKVRRDIGSVPLRSARDTWRSIIDLITGSGSIDAGQLDSAASVMETLIAEEQLSRAPIVVSGCGSRLVIYCAYLEAAVDLGASIDRLAWNPTGDGWQLCAPASSQDVAWMNQTLGARASRITVYDAAVGLPEDRDTEHAAKAFEIDWKGFGTG